MKIVISGGGIVWLTLALTAKKAGHVPIILEQRDAVDKPSFGGGIGLWPPSITDGHGETRLNGVAGKPWTVYAQCLLLQQSGIHSWSTHKRFCS